MKGELLGWSAVEIDRISQNLRFDSNSTVTCLQEIWPMVDRSGSASISFTSILGQVNFLVLHKYHENHFSYPISHLSFIVRPATWGTK